MKAFYLAEQCSIVGYHANGQATIQVKGVTKLVHQSEIAIKTA